MKFYDILVWNVFVRCLKVPITNQQTRIFQQALRLGQMVYTLRSAVEFSMPMSPTPPRWSAEKRH